MSEVEFPMSELQEALLAAGPSEPLGKQGYAMEVTTFDQKHYFAVVSVKGKLGPEWATDFANRLRAASDEAAAFDEWTIDDKGTDLI